MASRLATGLLLAAGLSLGACYSDDYGYGYGGVALSYGSLAYYPGYQYPYSYPYPAYPYPGYFGGWGHYRAYPYWGWHDGYYYPGSGVYVYDRWRRPHHWNDGYRRYWGGRRDYWRGRGEWSGHQDRMENWDDFEGHGGPPRRRGRD